MASIIVKKDNQKVLMVNDCPFLMLAGEVHNSSSSTTEYMEHVWKKAEELGLNSVLLPITWELLEPEEGVFNFELVEGLIKQAREYEMKIGFLWFGAWKNAQCYYAPEWVKSDTKRFKRAQVEKGKNFIRLKEFYNMSYTTLSYLCEATCDADARAFRALMQRIKEVDEKETTVVLVQVENEMGVQGAAREYSDEADIMFEGPVPQDFISYLMENKNEMAADIREEIEKGAKAGSWPEVFGAVAEEVFSAYHIAGYVEKVALAGKEVYSLPLTVNCWLNKGDKPGVYPSGGPVARVMEVWQYRAPSIDVYGADIYARNFLEVCDEYKKRGNPLFIPETATHSHAGPRLLYTVGHYHAMGFAPFGFENMGKPFSATESYLFGVDTEDPAMNTPQDVSEYCWINKTLHDMIPVLVEKYGTDDLKAAIKEKSKEETLIFGDYGIRIVMESPVLTKTNGACLVLRTSENEFYMIAYGCCMAPFSTNPGRPNIDILALEEGCFYNNKWKRIRRLNGDEVAITRYEKPTLLRLKLFAYPEN